MIKAIEFYLKNNVDTSKIRMYVNEIYGTDLTIKEVKECVENIQKTRSQQAQILAKSNRHVCNWF